MREMWKIAFWVIVMVVCLVIGLIIKIEEVSYD